LNQKARRHDLAPGFFAFERGSRSELSIDME